MRICNLIPGLKGLKTEDECHNYISEQPRFEDEKVLGTKLKLPNKVGAVYSCELQR